MAEVCTELQSQNSMYNSPQPNTLPLEIIEHIISFIRLKASCQATLWACTLVSRAWYSASIRFLYEKPYLSGGNFDQFVSTICPSKNAHIRTSPLATLVRHLDMGGLVHNSSRSLTARLLGRLKGNLEAFVAPQVSFAVNSFAALCKCTKLRYLNLSLISASISNKSLFQTLKSLIQLEILFFPRSSNKDLDAASELYTWPPRLKALHIACSIDDQFIFYQLHSAPKTLSTLSIQHCPQLRASSINFALTKLGSNLENLAIRHPLPQISRGTLNYVLEYCPYLIALRISADYITDEIFTRIPPSHPLRTLDLECSPSADSEVNITPNAIFHAIDQELLPNLRRVRVSARLAWDSTLLLRSDAIDLSELLETMELETPLNMPSGVWFNLPD
ncbi:F-box domain protein/F-box domain-containing protein (translation) [Blumeria hordei DH14]|uniref:F-box domain protein/F-box domain-containing protein (Translation) n=1 Tax=Blumeria graminis f. sp. hordei (strain DH14) TaxID=546991 RepID=N1JGL0_BLUG1|nr:F-box domain protein/F-box domain-containing protein (translation) [Blumeria hordei DH14]